MRQDEVEFRDDLGHPCRCENCAPSAEQDAVARWICKSGYWRHVADSDKQWRRCWVEAGGLIEDLLSEGYRITRVGQA